MKKWFLLLLVLALLGSCAALAESGKAPAQAAFESKWVNENGSVDIWYEEDGYRVTVTQDTDEARTIWEYSCVDDPDNGTLVSVSGVKTHAKLNELGEPADWESDYDVFEPTATFSLDGLGRLTWADTMEDAGKGLAFEKIGHFEGNWICDRASITILWSDERYEVEIEWADSAWVTHRWSLIGAYNAKDNTIEANGMETVWTYDDNGAFVSSEDVNPEGCSAVFSLNQDGKLVWQDDQVPHAAGMAFEYNWLD